MFAHIDADAFFASVLQRKYPRLKGKALLALGMGGGCVIAASYEAKAKGVRTGMRLVDAKKIVPEAIFLPADFHATYDATRQLFALFEKFCPGGVEHASPDEGYLDLTHTRRSVAFHTSTNGWESFAREIQSESDRFLDLPISIGIAPTKTLAKMGSKHRKPKGICIIEEKDREAFLGEKDISSIPGIGWKSTPKMKKLGFLTAFDFAHADPLIIEKVLGKTGLELQREIRGEAIYKVITNPPPPKSISRCRSFRGTNDRNFLYSQVMTHLQRCSSKLRRHELECARIGIWFRGADYKSGASAERSIGRYVAEESLLMPSVREMFEEVIQTQARLPLVALRSRAKWGAPTRFTQAGLVLSDFRPKGSRQISLFEEPESHEEIAALQISVDLLRKKYGTESVRFGGSILFHGTHPSWGALE
ncbi:MAG TPA: DNA polymerase IV [Candidatus Peribacterales bacterium]|nr:DNA polymerase IV [Candidatus Peribacterales bacterium]